VDIRLLSGKKDMMKKIIIGLLAMASVSAFADNIEWQNSKKTSDGTIWSDVIPGQFFNCFPKKTSAGELIRDDWGIVKCVKKADGTNLGISTDHKSIIDSDAIRACRSIGGDLPAEADFLKLENDPIELPGMSNRFFWSSTISDSGHVDFGFGFGKDENGVSYYNPELSVEGYVRCIKH
jgi:hypothetical protein